MLPYIWSWLKSWQKSVIDLLFDQIKYSGQHMNNLSCAILGKPLCQITLARDWSATLSHSKGLVIAATDCVVTEHAFEQMIHHSFFHIYRGTIWCYTKLIICCQTV